jgi:molybdopterin converting factor subunit 1
MKATVRLFARLADLAGTREVELDLGEGLTAADVLPLLARHYPALAGFDASLMYAVNSEYADPSQPIRDGDEIALIPPVSGGACVV